MALLYLIAALSGFAALVYQMLWVRELALVLGSTTASISTVVAAFMGGLALGSGVIGRWVDRRGGLLRVYALLEVGIGLSAIVLALAIPWLDGHYLRLAHAASGSPGLLVAVRFLATFALLLVPTALMGGTFPVLVKALTRDIRHLGGTVGLLYATNTFGAVAGCLAAGIHLIGALGLDGTRAVAVALNLIAAAGALGLERSHAAWRAGAPPAADRPRDSALRSTAATPSAARAVAWAIGISGAIALGYEIVWSRALAIVLGHSIYAFTFVLATYLAGVASGGALAAPFLDRLRRPERAFAGGLLALATLSGACFYLVPLLPFRDYSLGVAPLAYIARNLVCAAALLALPTLLLGALLPLAIRVCTGSLERAGADAGRIYAWNTLGAIGGSVATGFVLIPRFGTQLSFLLLVSANLVLSLVVGLRLRWPAPWTPLAALALVLAALGLSASGGSPILRRKVAERLGRQLDGRLELHYYGEDQVASIGLARTPDGIERLVANGVPMTHWGLETLWMAHLPLAMVEDPHDVLVLCLGMGNTYRAATLHPVRVTAVELSPRVVEAYGVLTGGAPVGDADDRIEVGDARHAVLVSDARFDVITVDPPPPLYAAGTVNFYTREFFELLRARIRPAGVVSQWVPLFDCTVDEFKSILRTFASVFDRAWVWIPSPAGAVTGVYLIGPGPEAAIDPARVRERLSSDPVAADVRRFSDAPPGRLLPRPVLREAEIDAFCGTPPILRDAHPFLEFPLFRNSGRSVRMDFETLLDHLRSHDLWR